VRICGSVHVGQQRVEMQSFMVRTLTGRVGWFNRRVSCGVWRVDCG
jgi:hypothetical protein